MGSSATLDRSPRANWIEKSGGLPPYVREVARSIHEKRGLPLAQAIPIALSTMKRWAAGAGDVNPDTRAKAQKAVAEWEATRARNKARQVKTANLADGTAVELAAVAGEVIELARYVRTAEGARRYGKPIGTLLDGSTRTDRMAGPALPRAMAAERAGAARLKGQSDAALRKRRDAAVAAHKAGKGTASVAEQRARLAEAREIDTELKRRQTGGPAKQVDRTGAKATLAEQTAARKAEKARKPAAKPAAAEKPAGPSPTLQAYIAAPTPQQRAELAKQMSDAELNQLNGAIGRALSDTGDDRVKQALGAKQMQVTAELSRRAAPKSDTKPAVDDRLARLTPEQREAVLKVRAKKAAATGKPAELPKPGTSEKRQTDYRPQPQQQAAQQDAPATTPKKAPARLDKPRERPGDYFRKGAAAPGDLPRIAAADVKLGDMVHAYSPDAHLGRYRVVDVSSPQSGEVRIALEPGNLQLTVPVGGKLGRYSTMSDQDRGRFAATREARVRREESGKRAHARRVDEMHRANAAKITTRDPKSLSDADLESEYAGAVTTVQRDKSVRPRLLSVVEERNRRMRTGKYRPSSAQQDAPAKPAEPDKPSATRGVTTNGAPDLGAVDKLDDTALNSALTRARERFDKVRSGRVPKSDTRYSDAKRAVDVLEGEKRRRSADKPVEVPERYRDGGPRQALAERRAQAARDAEERRAKSGPKSTAERVAEAKAGVVRTPSQGAEGREDRAELIAKARKFRADAEAKKATRGRAAAAKPTTAARNVAGTAENVQARQDAQGKANRRAEVGLFPEDRPIPKGDGSLFDDPGEAGDKTAAAATAAKAAAESGDARALSAALGDMGIPAVSGNENRAQLAQMLVALHRDNPTRARQRIDSLRTMNTKDSDLARERTAAPAATVGQDPSDVIAGVSSDTTGGRRTIAARVADLDDAQRAQMRGRIEERLQHLYRPGFNPAGREGAEAAGLEVLDAALARPAGTPDSDELSKFKADYRVKDLGRLSPQQLDAVEAENTERLRVLTSRARPAEKPERDRRVRLAASVQKVRDAAGADRRPVSARADTPGAVDLDTGGRALPSGVSPESLNQATIAERRRALADLSVGQLDELRAANERYQREGVLPNGVKVSGSSKRAITERRRAGALTAEILRIRAAKGGDTGADRATPARSSADREQRRRLGINNLSNGGGRAVELAQRVEHRRPARAGRADAFMAALGLNGEIPDA